MSLTHQNNHQLWLSVCLQLPPAQPLCCCSMPSHRTWERATESGVGHWPLLGGGGLQEESRLGASLRKCGTYSLWRVTLVGGHPKTGEPGRKPKQQPRVAPRRDSSTEQCAISFSWDTTVYNSFLSHIGDKVSPQAG